jgi:preprotein translocase subunit SecA
MKFRLEDYVQRELNFCIVDEVDSILIDEARTPLIISGPTDDSTDLYYKIDRVILQAKLEKGVEASESPDGKTSGDYTVDEKSKTAALTEAGVDKVEKLIGVENLYDPNNIELLHHVNQGLRAHVLFKLDVDYVVKDGEVMIVDEFTGRLMPGRRWSDGLHQAIEAKENVEIENENQTLATITFQNYFRMYNKLSGMTGTADTEATEFSQIYKLEVTVIPTNRAMIRNDEADVIFKNEAAKLKNITSHIKELHEKGQPILVGTVSVEKSERISAHLKQMGIRHHVLNAKQHEREADIIAQAGRKGSVTIATNMAGRGTDILLGGNPEFLAKAEVGPLPKDADDAAKAEHSAKTEEALKRWQEKCAAEKKEVLAAGGLFILGTERHESRRIDNQLRGRSGRQGDPGSSRFYLSLQDNLLRIFGGEGLVRWMKRFGMKEDEALEDRMISRQIEKAQRKVEQHNFDIRKNLLEYDDVANDQRKVIYRQRDELLEEDDVSATVADIREDVVDHLVHRYVPADSIDEQWDIAGLERELDSEFGMSTDLKHWLEQQSEADAGTVLNHVRELIDDMFQAKEKQIGPDTMRQLEKHIMLSVVDNAWKEHLASMDYMRQGIYLRGYAQQDPKQAFKRESFDLFSQMLARIKTEVTQMLARIRIRSEEEVAAMEAEQQRVAERMQRQMQASGGGAPVGGALGLETPIQPVATEHPVASGPKVGRNDPCPCGSGKKYKHCHGQLS